jgi:biopolymer transport protein ExbD
MARSILSRRKAKRDAASGPMPVDSFSDIAFLLIIFFIVATTLMESEGFEANLPSATESSSTDSQKNVPTISLQGEQILYDTDEVSLEEMRQRLAELHLKEQEERLRIVRLQSSPSVNLGTYYATWAAIANNGGVVVIVKESK